jgi:hypothetical protein
MSSIDRYGVARAIGSRGIYMPGETLSRTAASWGIKYVGTILHLAEFSCKVLATLLSLRFILVLASNFEVTLLRHFYDSGFKNLIENHYHTLKTRIPMEFRVDMILELCPVILSSGGEHC